MQWLRLLVCLASIRSAAQAAEVFKGLPRFENFLQSAEASKWWLVKLRRTLHQTAEVAYEEHETSRILQKELSDLQVNFTSGWGKRTLPNGTVIGGTAIVAEIGDGKSPCIALRADIDALPIRENTGLPFASSNGAMHACGHDSHAAMLIGAAKLLKEEWKRQPWKGTVRLIFQHAEEAGNGAIDLIEEGVLRKEPAVQHAFAIHVNAERPSGEVSGKAGAQMAGYHGFDISIKGRGGHAALPHLTVDPVTAAASVIANLNTIISREANPTDETEMGVISVTSINTPDSYNIIPSEVQMKGAIRALSVEFLKKLVTRLHDVAVKTAEALRCTATVTDKLDNSPPLLNDEALWLWSTHKLMENQITVKEVPPKMASEDFAYYALKVPSVLLNLGASPPNAEIVYPHHSENFVMDEKPLPTGATILAFLAHDKLRELADEIEGPVKVDGV